MVHGPNWVPKEVPVQIDGAVKALGVHYDLALTGQTQLDLSTSEIRQLPAAARYKPASPDTLKAAAESCLINKAAYKGGAIWLILIADHLIRQTLGGGVP